MVVLPETVEQCQQVVRYCSKHNIPLIARGAGTGLSGGALPRQDGVLRCRLRCQRKVGRDQECKSEGQADAGAVAG